MSVQNLANAPLIDTDIPTTEAYYDKALPAGSPAGSDINRRYYPGSAGTNGPSVMSMDNLPNSFGIDANQKGIIAAFNVLNYDGSTTIRVAMRKPTVSLRDYITGWDDLPDLALTIPNGTTDVTTYGGTAVASQRQGQYAYVFQHYERFGLFTDTLYVKIFKVTRDEYVEVAGVAGGGSRIDGDSTDDFDPIISSMDNGQYFVSDEEEPFIWNVYNGVAGGNTAYWTGFRDDNSQEIGYRYRVSGGTLHPEMYVGQTAAFYQEFTLPTGVYGYGPYLVQPWSSGAYGSPELWYLVYEFDELGQTTGRFVIYRAKWKKGEYVKPSGVTFADDPDFEAGRTAYPALNPLGYSFERDIFNDAHKVGVIGPFQGIPVYNPQNNTIARFQNSGTTTLTKPPLTSPSANPLGFNIVRDTKRQNVLHMVIADGGIYPTDGTSLNRIWFTNTSDDGATWSRIAQIGPAIEAATQGTASGAGRINIPTKYGLVKAESVGYEDYLAPSGSRNVISVPPVVRTHDDVLLMGNLTRFTNYTLSDGTSPRLHAYPDDFGAKIALAVVDYTGLGAANSARDTVLYVQKTQAGQISWQ